VPGFLLEDVGQIGQNCLHREYANCFDLSVQPLAPPSTVAGSGFCVSGKGLSNDFGRGNMLLNEVKTALKDATASSCQRQRVV
jgi:hypothetical protein